MAVVLMRIVVAIESCEAARYRARQLRGVASDVERARESVLKQVMEENHPPRRHRTVEVADSRFELGHEVHVRPRPDAVERNRAGQRAALELAEDAPKRARAVSSVAL
jgi:hypothetical protein